MRAALKAVAAALVLACAAPVAQAEAPASVPLAQAATPQIEAAAVAALAGGRRAEVLAMARELLARDPNSTLGHYLVARVMLGAGDTAAARKEARLSFGAAQSRRQRYEAARLAGQVALTDKRWAAAQYWARQTIQYAPDARARAVGVNDFRRLRAASPYSFRLKVGVRPTSNANGGADERGYVVDGIATPWTLSPDAMALRGVVGTANADFSWRIAQDARSVTTLGLSGYGRAIEFAGTPLDGTGAEVRNADYSAASLGLSLTQARAFGAGLSGSATLEAGRMWQGGAPAYDWLGLQLDGSKLLAPNLRANLGADFEQRDWQGSARHDIRRALSFGVVKSSATGDVSLGLGASNLASSSGQARSWSLSASLGYAPKAQIGPVSLSLSAGLSKTVYPDYTALFLANGREDNSTFAEIGLWAPGLGVAAFAPEVKLQAVRVRSNISRFSYSEVAVALGWRSAF